MALNHCSSNELKFSFVAFSREVKKSLELLYSSRSRFKVLKPNSKDMKFINEIYSINMLYPLI